jgi:hypothetical protein
MKRCINCDKLMTRIVDADAVLWHCDNCDIYLADEDDGWDIEAAMRDADEVTDGGRNDPAESDKWRDKPEG